MKTLHILNKIILAASTLTLFSACADLNQDGEEMDAVNKIIGGQIVQNAPDHAVSYTHLTLPTTPYV